MFDEASQIGVADPIVAMGRGRSAVTVGDSKQMPPTSIAEATAVTSDLDEPSETDAVEDEESILSECIQAGVSRIWLSWHYRREGESLIAFSNQQYCEGRLSSFPAPIPPGVAARDGRGIRLVRVDGQFQREGKGKLLRTNLVEAQAVVDEIRRRFGDSPDGFPSLGVVTFNVQQRNLIENLLLDSVPWSQRATTGDRDALPVDVLGGKLHWSDVQRVWLPEWLQDPAGVTDPLWRRRGRRRRWPLRSS